MTKRGPEKPKAWWAITKADVLIWVVLLILALAAWWLTETGGAPSVSASELLSLPLWIYSNAMCFVIRPLGVELMTSA